MTKLERDIVEHIHRGLLCAVDTLGGPDLQRNDENLIIDSRLHGLALRAIQEADDLLRYLLKPSADLPTLTGPNRPLGFIYKHFELDQGGFFRGSMEGQDPFPPRGRRVR
jgi:hypothetical protein